MTPKLYRMHGGPKQLAITSQRSKLHGTLDLERGVGLVGHRRQFDVTDHEYLSAHRYLAIGILGILNNQHGDSPGPLSLTSSAGYII